MTERYLTITRAKESELLAEIPQSFHRVYWAIWRAAKTGQVAPALEDLLKTHGSCSHRVLKDCIRKMERSGLLIELDDGLDTGWHVPSINKQARAASGYRSRRSRRLLEEYVTKVNNWSAALNREPTEAEADQFLHRRGPLQTDKRDWSPAQKIYLALYGPYRHPSEIARVLGKTAQQIQANAARSKLAHITQAHSQRSAGLQPANKPVRDFKITKAPGPLDSVKVEHQNVMSGAYINHYALRRMNLTLVSGCRWIHSELGDVDHPRNCGALTRDGGSWCDEHRAIVFTGEKFGGKKEQDK